MPKLIKNISKHKYKILAIGYTIWLSVLSLTPLNNVPLPQVRFGDKVVHFFLYFFLAIFWLQAYPSLKKIKYLFLMLLISWGIAIEFVQEYFIFSRTGDIYDALANSIGAITGFYLYHRLKR